MAIPEINSEQVSALTEMVAGVGAISVMVPDMRQDTREKYNMLTAELCDLNQLAILGLLKDVTEDHKEKLATMYAMSNRFFRIFEITEIGRKLFDSVDRKVQ